jgi:hypothetical protein
MNTSSIKSLINTHLSMICSSMKTPDPEKGSVLKASFILKYCLLKGQCREIFDPRFFH